MLTNFSLAGACASTELFRHRSLMAISPRLYGARHGVPMIELLREASACSSHVCPWPGYEYRLQGTNPRVVIAA
jgi:hypothetical protein